MTVVIGPFFSIEMDIGEIVSGGAVLPARWSREEGLLERKERVEKASQARMHLQPA